MKSPVIGIVGVCGAGKSTLIAGLKTRGIVARHIAQEHSYVKDMWQRLTHPDVLIFLEVSYPNTIHRRRLDWTEAEYAEQLFRLRHARQYADLVIQTDGITPEEVIEEALRFLNERFGYEFYS